MVRVHRVPPTHHVDTTTQGSSLSDHQGDWQVGDHPLVGGGGGALGTGYETIKKGLVVRKKYLKNVKSVRDGTLEFMLFVFVTLFCKIHDVLFLCHIHVHVLPSF